MARRAANPRFDRNVLNAMQAGAPSPSGLSVGGMEFDNDRALLLIDLYRRHRALWDPKDPLYYSKSRKGHAWIDIAAKVGGSVQEIRRKMESLLGSFRRERSRAARTALRGRRHYTSAWFAYDKMKFLINRDNPKKPRRLRADNACVIIPDVSVDADDAGALFGDGDAEAAAAAEAPLEAAPFLEGLHSTFRDALLEAHPLEAAAPEAVDVKPSALVPPRALARDDAHWAAPPPMHLSDSWRPRRVSTKSAQEAANSPDEETEEYIARGLLPAPPPPPQDEAGAFGQYVASKLRRYSARARAVVEHLVSGLLFEADMGKHDGPPAQEDGERARGNRSPSVVVTYQPLPGAHGGEGAARAFNGHGGEGDGGLADVKLEPQPDVDYAEDEDEGAEEF